MVLRSNPRIRPEDEIQPAPEPSPGSVIARIGGLSVGSRQSSAASSQKSQSSSKTTKSSKSSSSSSSKSSSKSGNILLF